MGQVKAIQCGSCKLWAHKDCEEMTDEEFNFLSKQKGSIVWHCTCCQASTVRLEDSIRQLEKRVKVNEEKIEQIDGRESATNNRLDRMERAIEEARLATSEVKKDTIKVVFEEVRERDKKKCNLIFHNVGETEGHTLEEEKEWDANSFDNIMQEMHVNLNFRGCARGPGRPRPLMVVLKKEQDRANILDNAHNLLKTKMISPSSRERLMRS